MERKEITFDSFVRGALVVAGFVGAYLLLDRLSNVLLPFFLAWLIAYMLFPLVKFFQYRCKMRYRVVAILCALIAVNLVLVCAFWLMIPPIIEEMMRVKDMLIEYVTKDALANNIPDQIEMFIREHLTAEDIKEIADTYHHWREESHDYQDIPGFCASVPVSRVAELDYVLTPGRYVGLPEEEDDFNFAERFTALKAEFEEQLKEEERLNKLIIENLSKIKLQ